MLIPMGFLAASGAGGGGAYELISTTSVSTATSTITFSSIPSTYKHLQIRFTAKASVTDADERLQMRINNSSSSVYMSHYLQGNGSTVTSGSGTTSHNIMQRLAWIPGQFYEGNQQFASGIIDILDTSSNSKNKTVRTFSGHRPSSYTPYVMLSSGLFADTTTVSSLQFNLFNSNNFVTGTRFSLYGIKGA